MANSDGSSSVRIDEGTPVRLRVTRQNDRSAAPYVEEFSVPYEHGMNVHAALMAVQRNPVTSGGKKSTPVAWDANCLEEVCGACTMNVNGKVRQACSTLVATIWDGGPIALTPMTKFPVVRDLAVDRRSMFENLKRVHAWIDLDGSYDLGPGPRYSQETWQVRYDLSQCMTCGQCLEVCPNVSPGSPYMGAAIISQVRHMNLHPSGAMHAEERLEAISGPAGVFGCGMAQNCVRVCPKEIPLTTSLADMMRATTRHDLRKLLGR